MSSRRRESLSPTLFPFLAVLICTLGTLILMLAILAHSGGNASAASDAPEEPAVDEVAIQELVEADAEIERRLGRPLEPVDLWYAGFKAGGAPPEPQLDAITRERTCENNEQREQSGRLHRFPSSLGA